MMAWILIVIFTAMPGIPARMEWRTHSLAECEAFKAEALRSLSERAATDVSAACLQEGGAP